MKEKFTQTIKLRELFGSTISTREAARFLLKEITEMSSKEKTKSIIIDFTKIEFISRSFADEFFKAKERIETQKEISLKFVRVNKIILDTLKKVKMTQKARPRKILKIPSRTIKNIENLEEIFSTL